MRPSMVARFTLGVLSRIAFIWIVLQECASDPDPPSTNKDVAAEVYKTVRDSGAVISSPGFPRHYDNDLELIYRVQGPPSDVVKLTVVHIDIEGNLVGGCHDRLKIFDGESSNESNFLRSLCGFSLPSPVYSSGPVMDLVFYTDATRSGTGFQAIVSFVKLEEKVATPSADVERALRAAYFSLAVAIVTMFVSLIGLLLLYRRQREHLSYQRSQTDALQAGVGGGNDMNAYAVAATKDEGKLDSANDEENASQGYIRMRPSKKHPKIPARRKFHDDPTMYCEPDTPKPVYDTSMVENDNSGGFPAADGEYHDPTNAEYEKPTGDGGYERPTGAPSGGDTEGVTGHSNEDRNGDGNTTSLYDTYEPLCGGGRDKPRGDEREQTVGGDDGGTDEESTYYSKDAYEAVSRDIELSRRDAAL